MGQRLLKKLRATRKKSGKSEPKQQKAVLARALQMG